MTKERLAPNRIDTAFAGLRERGEKGLITFITAGDPDLPTTKKIILEIEKSGADILELGMPFSDPMADGLTIQASYERALKHHAAIPDVLALVRSVRKKSPIPVVLFGYYNPVLQYGLERFAKDARAAGVDGALIVDLPPEEADDLKVELDKVGLHLIFLLTPTSDSSRMRLVCSKSSGFIYFVSVTGVTGARKSLSSHVPAYVKKIRKFTNLPIGVGFGISTPEQAHETGKFADAVVVGSAIINVIAANMDKPARLVKEAGGFVAGLKKGIMG